MSTRPSARASGEVVGYYTACCQIEGMFFSKVTFGERREGGHPQHILFKKIVQNITFSVVPCFKFKFDYICIYFLNKISDQI